MALISKGFVGRRRGDDGRTPPGQYLTKDFPVLAIGPAPVVATDTWSFSVTSESGETREWTWDEFAALPHETPTVDIHCVTKWSKLDTSWNGVSLDLLLDGMDTDAGYVVVHGYDGYTTNLALDDFAAEDALLAHSWSGEPLSDEHGGPVRLVVPHLYFWKSAKWVQSIEFLTEDAPGFWEVRGYHNRGDPWAEQRYSGD
jgi:DMSO/TMAO reductase YedYZ molybdopterin-dependent catalytic subunit